MKSNEVFFNLFFVSKVIFIGFSRFLQIKTMVVNEIYFKALNFWPKTREEISDRICRIFSSHINYCLRCMSSNDHYIHSLVIYSIHEKLETRSPQVEARGRGVCPACDLCQC